MFENLSDKLERAFKVLKGEGKITEINVAETLKEVKIYSVYERIYITHIGLSRKILLVWIYDRWMHPVHNHNETAGEWWELRVTVNFVLHSGIRKFHSGKNYNSRTSTINALDLFRRFS